MMEVENESKTDSQNETPSCSSSDCIQIIQSSIEEECRQISDEVSTIAKKITKKIHSSVRHNIDKPSCSYQQPELSNNQHDYSEMDTDETKTVGNGILRNDALGVNQRCKTEHNHLPGCSDNSQFDQSDEGSPKAGISPNEDSSETVELNSAESYEESSSFDARRTRRKCKRKLEGDYFCPVCGITVREPELASHFAQEVEKLSRISVNSMKLRPRSSDGNNTTYEQVKSNRENRLTAKVAQYAAKEIKEVPCPVCKLRLSGDEEDINKHVAFCVQNQNEYDEHVVVDDDEDDESYEEYEIGEETRIRAISLISGGYRSLEGPSSKRNRADETEDLEIDVDDTLTYGEAQYTELDIIPHFTDEDSEELRRAVLGSQFTLTRPPSFELQKWKDVVAANGSADASSELPDDTIVTADSWSNPKTDECNSERKNCISELAVNSMKERIKELEDQNKNVKCLICLEPYTNPVVSTTCWHVHCEECWLITMGVKKLCPQCNMIVFPADLRKIYL